MPSHNQHPGRRAPVAFKQRDAARLVRATRSAGYEVVGVEAKISRTGTTLRVLTGAADKNGNSALDWESVARRLEAGHD